MDFSKFSIFRSSGVGAYLYENFPLPLKVKMDFDFGFWAFKWALSWIALT